MHTAVTTVPFDLVIPPEQVACHFNLGASCSIFCAGVSVIIGFRVFSLCDYVTEEYLVLLYNPTIIETVLWR